MTMGRSGIRARVIFLGEVDLARSLGGRKRIEGGDWKEESGIRNGFLFTVTK